MRERDSSAGVLPVTDLEGATSTAQAAVGTITGLNDDGTVEMQFAGSSKSRVARLAVAASRERLELAVVERQGAVAVFEGGDVARPIVIGFVEPLLPEPASLEAGPQILEADVDGRRVRVTAADEIVLQCGSASITLRRNGRVIVKGTYVETHSEGTNRIKGGQILLN